MSVEPDDIPASDGPRRPRILIAEDSAMMLVMLKAMCSDAGWDVVGPATRVEEAVRLAREDVIDAALLDANLAGDMVWETADVLVDRAVPFAFSTGYAAEDLLPDRLKGWRIFAKPYPLADVEDHIRQMLTRSK